MTLSSLIPCPACARHVRGSEVTCPFCAAPLEGAATALAAVPEGSAAVRSPSARLSRAALFALGALGAGVAACNGPQTRSIYGGPPPDLGLDAGAPLSAADAGAPEPVSVPAYGAPPPMMFEDAAPPSLPKGPTKKPTTK